MLFRFRKQKERRRSQQLFQVFQHNVQRNGRMEDARMSNDPQEFVNARPGIAQGTVPSAKFFRTLRAGLWYLLDSISA